MDAKDFERQPSRWRIRHARVRTQDGRLIFTIWQGTARINKIGRHGRFAFFSIAEAMEAIGEHLRGVGYSPIPLGWGGNNHV